MKAARRKPAGVAAVNGGEPANGLPPLTVRIANLAHSYWESEGRPEGKHLEHWFRAEAELTAREPGAVQEA